ncbi:MAG: iron-sulfur cluster-binding domain-containing protein [Oxalobacter sp.]|nr:iron-sulfur cluster-binding domain-containing protein [Oxalobacter sp.]
MQKNNPNPDGLTLISTVEEAADTKSFFFRHPATGKIRFKPGQFINIGVQIDGKPHYRSYSISSLPEDELMQLTIKRVEGGLVSNWMIDQLKVGESVSMHGVAGAFNIIDQPPAEHIVFISAGCGVTPVMSMAKYILSHKETGVKSIQFIHCARDRENIIYQDEILSLEKNHPDFHAFFYLSAAREDQVASPYRAGRLNSAFLYSHLKDIVNNSSVYLCGPMEFMDMVKKGLMEIHFDLACLFHEDFTFNCEVLPGLAAFSVQETVENGHGGNTYKVTAPDFDFDGEAQEGEILLDVLQNGGVPIIGACRVGLCGACKCRVKSGDVKLTTDPVASGILTQADREEGYTLACVSLVIDDVQISLK